MFGRRRYWRTSIRAEVECRLPGGVIFGELCDLHHAGAFLRPDIAFLRGWYLEPQSILGRIASYGPVEVSYSFGQGLPALRARGVIRWIGRSAHHGCPGIGIELVPVP